MPRLPRAAIRSVLPPVCAALVFFASGVRSQAQETPPAPETPPAFLSVVEGVVTLEREGESEPAVRDMPFVTGDRLRTENGRAEIQFPDGTAIEIGEDSLVEAVTPSRVRLLAGTMDHIQGRTADTGATTSAAYLPADLQTYGDTFDRDGSWQYAAPYGYVWYPKVAVDWRPYYYGSWSAVPSYGWTWIGIDRWSWPTHHYGRWGYARNSWFWIPGRTWGAAWVSWAAASDYVSWCPLGYDGRPVFGLSVIAADFGPRYRDHGWNGWTVMSRRQFGVRGAYAHRNAVEPRQLPENTPFVVQSRPPAHQSSVAGHQSSVASRQSSVGSRQSSVGSRQFPVRSQPSPVSGRQSVGRGAGFERPATEDHRLPTDDWRLATPRAATPRVAIPRAATPRAMPRVEAPRAAPAPQDGRQTIDDRRLAAPRAAPGASVFEQPRVHPLGVPRAIDPARSPQPLPPYRAATPAYQPPGYRQAPRPEAPRVPPVYATPRYSAPPSPVQRAPSAPPAAASAPAPVTPPPPVRATPHAGAAPAGAAREGTARRR
jgi:hypothetical protein